MTNDFFRGTTRSLRVFGISFLICLGAALLAILSEKLRVHVLAVVFGVIFIGGMGVGAIAWINGFFGGFRHFGRDMRKRMELPPEQAKQWEEFREKR